MKLGIKSSRCSGGTKADSTAICGTTNPSLARRRITLSQAPKEPLREEKAASSDAPPGPRGANSTSGVTPGKMTAPPARPRPNRAVICRREIVEANSRSYAAS